MELTVSNQEPYFYLGPRPITLENLRDELLVRVKGNPETSLTINVDTDAHTAKLINLIDAVRAAGVEAPLAIRVKSPPKRETR